MLGMIGISRANVTNTLLFGATVRASCRIIGEFQATFDLDDGYEVKFIYQS